MWRCVWVALMVVFTPLGARDGDSKWQAWVRSANKLILIDSGGIVTRVAVLPLDDRQKEIRETVFSHDGRYVLYTTANPRDYRIPKQVLIYDVWHNKVLVKENLNVFGIQLNDSNDTAAYVYRLAKNQYRMEVISLPEAHLVLSKDIDLNSFNTDFSPDDGVTSVVSYFRYDQIMLSINDSRESYNILWTQNCCNKDKAVGISKDVIERWSSTGELLIKLDDNKSPGVRDKNGFYNTLQIYDPKIDSRQIVYNGDVNFSTQARFVQNGERVILRFSTVVAGTSRGHKNGYPVVQDRWLLVDREGHTIDSWTLQLNRSVWDIYAIPNGFIYTLGQNSLNQYPVKLPVIYEMDTRTGFGESRIIWSFPFAKIDSLRGDYNTFRIVWVGNTGQ